MIIKSPYPSFTPHEGGIWHFLFENNKSQAAHTQTMHIDAATGESLRFDRIKALTQSLAYTFRVKYGLDPAKDVVFVCSQNTVYYPTLIHGITAAGLTGSLGNHSGTVEDIMHYIQLSQATLMIIHSSVVPKMIQIQKLLSIPDDKILLIDRVHPGGTPFKTIWQVVDESRLWDVEPVSPNECKTKVAYLCFSSGTTGLPKAVATSHYNATSIFESIFSIDQDLYGRKQTYLCFLPLFHMYGHVWATCIPFYTGAKVVLMEKFDPLLMLQCIPKYKVTFALLVPPVVIFLVKNDLPSKFDLSSVKYWLSGAAPLGGDVIDAFEKRYGKSVLNGYGMSETTCVISLPYPTKTDPKTGSVGRLIPNMEAKIDEEGGELLVRGPNIMLGYFRNDKANSETFHEGWLRTGDVCEYNPQTQEIAVVDRAKELIKYKGFQVAPAELEALLLQHPKVEDSAVIGIFDSSQQTELPRAYVVVNVPPGQLNATLEEIQEWVKRKVSHQKWLRGGVFALPAIPKSASGKILRKDLRKLAAAQGRKHGL